MKSVSFRLSESDIELLKRLAEERGASKTAVIRDAIHALDSVSQDEIPQGEGGILDVLAAQLDVKDAQIAALNDALARSQALQLDEAHPQLLDAPDQGKSRWQRLRQAWHG